MPDRLIRPAPHPYRPSPTAAPGLPSSRVPWARCCRAVGGARGGYSYRATLPAQRAISAGSRPAGCSAVPSTAFTSRILPQAASADAVTLSRLPCRNGRPISPPFRAITSSSQFLYRRRHPAPTGIGGPPSRLGPCSARLGFRSGLVMDLQTATRSPGCGTPPITTR